MYATHPQFTKRKIEHLRHLYHQARRLLMFVERNKEKFKPEDFDFWRQSLEQFKKEKEILILIHEEKDPKKQKQGVFQLRQSLLS